MRREIIDESEIWLRSEEKREGGIEKKTRDNEDEETSGKGSFLFVLSIFGVCEVE